MGKVWVLLIIYFLWGKKGIIYLFKMKKIHVLKIKKQISKTKSYVKMQESNYLIHSPWLR
jgi:hypothetical protein